MPIEIERKFLVKNNSFLTESHHSYSIKQGFLNSHKKRAVRIRITDEKAFITIKGKSNKKGTIRYEWEKEIDKTEAEKLLTLCEKNIIKKNRHLIKVNKHLFEVDIFDGENEGLIIAEVELNSENELFTKPSWLGKEVTGDIRYYNSNLSKNPFKNWT